MSLCAELFSDLFARGDNPLSRLDPRTKLVAASAMLLCVVFSTSPLLPLMMLMACTATAIAVGVPWRFAAMRLGAPLGMALVLLMLQATLTGSSVLWSTHCLGWKIVVSREGLHRGCLMASRVLGAVSVMQLLSAVTPAHRLFLGLRALGAPRGWVELALIMYRYVFTLLELTSDVTAAQRLRLGYSTLRRGLSSAGVVAGTVILRSVDQSVRTAEAMRVRGYRGDIPMGTLPPMAQREWWIMIMVLVAMAGLFGILEKR